MALMNKSTNWYANPEHEALCKWGEANPDDVHVLTSQGVCFNTPEYVAEITQKRDKWIAEYLGNMKVSND